LSHHNGLNGASCEWLTRDTWNIGHALTLLLAGCGNTSIVGRWEKVPSPQPTSESTIGALAEVFADAMYPQKIEFFRDGTYAASPSGMLSGGEYQIREGKRLRLKTYIGLSVYEFSISGDVLTLRDENGREILYRRAQ